MNNMTKCAYMRISDVIVKAECKSEKDCGATYDRACLECEDLVIKIEYEISRV